MPISRESFQFIDSAYKTNFRDGLANAGASSFANLIVGGSAGGGQFKAFIESIRILSLQNLDWRVEFYSKSNTGGYGLAPYFTSPSFISGGQYPTATNPDASNLCGYVDFYSSTTAQQATPTLIAIGEASRVATAYATLFSYFASSLRIPVADDDANTNISNVTTPGGLLHVNLVNTNGGKTAGDAGLVQIRFGIVTAG